MELRMLVAKVCIDILTEKKGSSGVCWMVMNILPSKGVLLGTLSDRDTIC